MSQPSQWHWWCDLVLPSCPGAGTQVIDGMLRQMKLLAWPEKDMFNVQLALEEAVTNAVMHGNHADPQKKVYFQCGIDENEVRISVRDDGNGFNPDLIPDPRHPNNLLIPSGRGILLIRHFMNRVEFLPDGNGIIMTKYRSE
ncbi:MAG: ATP-binding protein, partial [Planctomycetaceae bacterium]|nr:ATP-binding protein [Planctomycetaceae bacterium]